MIKRATNFLNHCKKIQIEMVRVLGVTKDCVRNSIKLFNKINYLVAPSFLKQEKYLDWKLQFYGHERFYATKTL